MEYQLIRSKRKTLYIEITSDGRVVVRAPMRYADAEIRELVASREQWIQKHLKDMARHIEEANRVRAQQGVLTEEELIDLTGRAKVDFAERVARWEPRVLQAKANSAQPNREPDDQGVDKEKAGIGDQLSFLKQLGLEDRSAVQQRAKAGVQSKGAEKSVNTITIRHQKTRWGRCNAKGNLSFNCLLMLAPPEVRDYVVVHELCHLLHMNHSKRFWNQVAKVMPNYKVAYN